MSPDLFRKEALDAQKASWLGEISLAQPLRLGLLTMAAVFAALATGLFLSTATYTKRSRVVGQLVPSSGLVQVVASATGLVNRLDVGESDSVAEGQTLAVIAVPRTTLTSGDTTSALEARLGQRREGLEAAMSAERQSLAAQRNGLIKQLDAAQRELRQLELEAATRQQQWRLAAETLERMRQLERGRYVSELQVTQQEDAALETLGEVQALQRQALSMRRTIAQLEQSLDSLPSQERAIDAEFHSGLAALDQERVVIRAEGELAVQAPVSGVVATQLAKPGQAVQQGQPLMVLLPRDGLLEAELMVPSRAIGFIDTGDLVLLRYHAYPHQKFGHHVGRVTRVSRSPIPNGERGRLDGSEATMEQRFRVTVALEQQAVTAYQRQEPLKPGMLLEADILGERRRLIEWLFEPLLTLRSSLAVAPNLEASQ